MDLQTELVKTHIDLTVTPLVPIQIGDDAPAIWCKLEFLNPSGSTKDRLAGFILEKALRCGTVRPGETTVIEASSGSTSIAIARVCARLGVRFLAVMPEGVSNERVLIIRAYGGEIHFTPGAQGIRGAIDETERLGREPGTFLPRQFQNPDNAESHRLGTGGEILEQISGGRIAAVVSGVGTGGTLVGLYQAFVRVNPAVIPVHARPICLMGAPEIECCSFSHRVPGVAECISQIFQPQLLPGLTTIEVPEEEVLATTRLLIRAGFPVGPSSGLNYCAARQAARTLTGSDATIVTVFPDRMERYFSTELFDPIRAQG